MRRDCQPCIIKDNQEYQQLKRIPFTEKNIAELDIQTALHNSPELLPVSKIEESYYPIKSLGMEISNIDNLFISPNGRITLVEAKLWRNSEASREVVAQTLDYAKKLSMWSYEDFEKKVQQASETALSQNQSLYEFVKESFPDDVASENEFHDAVQKTLRTGRFLLLIVGDGIKENLEGMLDMLHRLPQMLFTFGLVEIQIYECAGIDGKLFIPQLILKTHEVERGIIKIADNNNVNISVDFDDNRKTQRESQSAKETLTESEFLDEAKNPATASLFKSLLPFMDEIGAFLSWRTSSVSFRLKDPKGSKQVLTLFVLTIQGKIDTGWLLPQLKNTSLDSNIALEMVEPMATIFQNVTVNKEKATLSRTLTSEEVSENFDEFTQILKDTVNRINEG